MHTYIHTYECIMVQTYTGICSIYHLSRIQITVLHFGNPCLTDVSLGSILRMIDTLEPVKGIEEVK